MRKFLGNSLINISSIGCVLFSACLNSKDENYMRAIQDRGLKTFYSSFSGKNSGWQRNECCTFDKENFSLLLQSKVPAIRLGNFLSKQETSTLATNIKAATFGTYEDTYPPIGKIGITQYEHSKKEKNAYFDRVDESYREAIGVIFL